jgi:nucleoside-diphosphate-sugar epimerase
MPDAIKATLQVMEATTAQITVRSSYNVGAISFSPKEIAAEIKKHISTFTIRYKPDFRQKIADSWPRSIDDSVARTDWGWQPDYTLPAMTDDILVNLKKLKMQEVI